jgi:hypothetical protein
MSFEMHSRKPWQPNLEHGEVSTLIKTKWDEHIGTLNKVDPWDQFQTIVTKWKKVFVIVMNVSYSQHVDNSPTCKDKWGAISR